MSEVEALRRALERERAARHATEELLEQRSVELYRLNDELAKRAAAGWAEVERGHQSYFYNSPTPQLEADFSAAARLAARARAEAGGDIEGWIADHAAEISECCDQARIKSVNPAALDLLAEPDIDALRDGFQSHFRDEYVTAFTGFLRNIVRGEPEFDEETRLYGAHGGAVDVYVHGRPALGSEKSLESVVCSIVDVTALKSVRAELATARDAAERASEAKSDMLAAASHDIRTELNAMLGLAQVLEAELEDVETREKVALIKRAGQELVSIISDILDLAKIEAGLFELDAEEAALTAFADDLDRLWRPTVQDKGVRFAVEPLFEDGAVVRFDARRSRQMINNLLSNALKFTEAGEIILTIALHEDAEGGPRLKIVVRDTGSGFDEAILPSLWNRFTQADGSVWKRFGGSGLGLSLVKKLAELMGGDVTARSIPGEGSTFEIIIPCEVCGAASGKAAQAAGYSLSNAGDHSFAIRVLAAEDNPLNQRVLRAMLEALGAEVDFAPDGEQAVKMATCARYDLILMDVCMPRMDGVEATRLIRALPDVGATPIVAVTADAMPGERQRLLAAGMDDMIPKPIDGVTLARAILRWTEREDAAPAAGVA